MRGLTVIAGGKYTTYRVMAKDAVDSAVHGLERSVPCAERIPLAGADGLLPCLQLPPAHCRPLAALDASWASWRGRAIEPHVNEALIRLGATYPELAGVQQAGPWWNRDNSLEVDIVARTAQDIATVGTIKWRPRGGVSRAEMAELAGARNGIPHAGGARLLAVCPSGLAPGASADIVMRPEDLLAAWVA